MRADKTEGEDLLCDKVEVRLLEEEKGHCEEDRAAWLRMSNNDVISRKNFISLPPPS